MIVKIVLFIFWSACYAFVFLWECLKANIDVAWRVLHPKLPIKPGIVKVKTLLRSDIGLTVLANSITLNPGSTTVDVDKDNGFLYIHLLKVEEGYDRSSMHLKRVARLENILRKIFD